MFNKQAVSRRGLWSRAPLAVKLGSGLAALGIVTVAVAGLAVSELSEMNHVATGIVEKNLTNTDSIASIQDLAHSTFSEFLLHDLASGNRQQMAAAQAAIGHDESAFATSLAALDSATLAGSPAQLRTLKASWAAVERLWSTRLLPDSLGRRSADFNLVYTSQMQPLANRLLATIASMSTAELRASLRAKAHARHVHDQAVISLLALLAAGLVVGSATAIVAVASVVRRLRDVSDVLSAVSTGDLTRSVDVRSTDEVGRIGSDLNTTIQSLSGLIGAIVANASMVASSSARISDVSREI